jgi:hypothetical protein
MSSHQQLIQLELEKHYDHQNIYLWSQLNSQNK